MMEILRSSAKGVVFKIVVIVIIAALLITGIASYLSTSSSVAMDSVATVNGESITKQTIDKAYQAQLQMMRQRYGDEAVMTIENDEKYKQQSKNAILDKQIDQILLQQYSKKLGIEVSESYLMQRIRSLPYFQKEGVFDNNTYLDVLEKHGMKPTHFAESVRQSLLTQPLEILFNENAFVADPQADYLISLFHQSRKVQSMQKSVEKLLAKQITTEEEISNFYQKNQENFRELEKIKINYAFVNRDEKQVAKITEAEIETYYTAHQDEFISPQRKNFSLIQIKTEEAAKKILAQLKNGANFTEIAKKHNQDPFLRKKGGDLGWLSETEIPKECVDANLKEKGQLSEIISSTLGYFIILLNDTKETYTKPLLTVKDDISQILQQNKNIAAYHELLDHIESLLSTNKPEIYTEIENLAAVKFKTTDSFDYYSSPEELLKQPIMQAIFDKEKLEIFNNYKELSPQLINIDDNSSIVVQIIDYQPEKIMPLDTVKASIVKTLNQEKAQLALRLEAEKLVNLLNSDREKGLIAIKKSGFEVAKKKQTFSRQSEEDPKFIEAIFALPLPASGKSTYGLFQDETGNVIIFEFLSFTPGELEPKQRENFITSITTNFSGRALRETILYNLRTKSKIEKK